jgi:pilus assembly protein CpaB
MRPKSIAMLMLAVGCGLVASIGITQLVANHSRTNGSGDSQIIIAQSDIALGEALTPQNAALGDWPKDKIPQGALTRAEDIDGRHTRTRLIAGEPILEGALWGKGAHDQGAAILIPQGYRPVTVKVDLVSGGGSLILPGDRVDVMLHVVKDPSHDIPETITRTILQDVKVFAVNDVTGMEEGKKDTGGKSIVAKTISLLVTPEQAAKVTLASQLGSIQLMMRSPDDNKLTDNVNARPADLWGGSGGRDDDEAGGPSNEKTKRSLAGPSPAAPAPSEAPQRPTWNMRVLKGAAVDDVQFEATDATVNPASPSGAGKGIVDLALKSLGIAVNPPSPSCTWKIVSGAPADPAPKDNLPTVEPPFPRPAMARPPLAHPPESRLEPKKNAPDKSAT